MTERGGRDVPQPTARGRCAPARRAPVAFSAALDRAQLGHGLAVLDEQLAGRAEHQVARPHARDPEPSADLVVAAALDAPRPLRPVTAPSSVPMKNSAGTLFFTHWTRSSVFRPASSSPLTLSMLQTFPLR